MKRLSDFLFNRKTKNKRSKTSRRRMLVEQLDRRMVLDTSFAAIAGVVFEDTNSSGGFNAGDTTFNGITVQLTNTTTATVLPTVQSGVNGEYRFDDLEAGTYELEQLAPNPGGGFTPITNPQTITITTAQADTQLGGGTVGVVIDSFDGDAQAVNAPPNPSRSSVSPVGGSVVGTERDIEVNVTAGTSANISTNSLVTFPDGVFDVDVSSDATATFNIAYDGADGDADPATTDIDGLGAIDVTSGGTATHIQLFSGSDGPGAGDQLTVRFTTVDPGNPADELFSEYVVNLQDFVGGGATGLASLNESLIAFTDPTSAIGADGAADFTNVGSITINGALVSSNGLDTSLAQFQTLGPNVISANIENQVLMPSIELTKLTNSSDNETTPGLGIAVGGNAAFTYIIENTGDTELTNIVLNDDNGTDTDFAAITLTSANTTETTGDGDAIFEPGEVWTITPAANSRTVTAGQYTNTATVTADPSGTGAGLAAVNDNAIDNHFGVDAQIVIEKATNGQDADATTGPLIAVGDTASFTYAVTNNGNVALDVVTVTDDNGTTADTTDDFTIVLTIGTVTSSGLAGALATNAVLDPGETWTTNPAAINRIVTAGQYTNNADVDANPVFDDGSDIAGILNVTDADPSNHFGVTTGITLEKATNGVDADSTTGPFITVGGTAAFTYAATNTGNVPLDTVVITDDNGTPTVLTDDFTLALTIGAVTSSGVAGALATNAVLDPGETWTITPATNNRVVTMGQYTNLGSVNANPVDFAGVDLGTFADVAATDPSNHFGAEPLIVIEKATNGVDADTGTGPLIGIGGTATFTYVVTNPGNLQLGSVVVTDNAGTPGNTADDFTAVFAGGDTDGDGFLDPGEVWNYTAVANTRTVTAGQYSNIGSVTGNPLDTNGADIAALGNVTDTDPSNHFGVDAQIVIEKATNGVDADTGTGPLILVGGNAVFTYTVTNPGNVELDGVIVTDDNGTPANLADDFTAVFSGGDTDGDGRLDPTETWTYTATANTRTVTAGQYSNIGSVTGNPVDSTGTDIAALGNVTDTDPSNHFGFVATVAIEKLTNGTDNDDATNPLQLLAGSTATFTYNVTNTSPNNGTPIPLSNIVVRDDNGTANDTSDDFNATFVSGDTDNDNLLDQGEVFVFTATRTVTEGLHTNIATVTANDPNGNALVADADDTDPDSHTGVVFSKRRFLASFVRANPVP